MSKPDTRVVRNGLATWLTLVGMCFSGSGLAQTARGGSGSDARMQALVQQFSTEKASLQAEANRLKEQIATLEKKVAKLEADNGSLTSTVRRSEGEVAAARDARDRMVENNQAAEARTKELIAKYRELADNLKRVEAERATLAAAIKTRTDELGTCSKDNVELATLASESLDRYEKKGCFGALAQAEPFTQIGQARVKNLRENYQQKIDALRLPLPEPASQPTAP